ncbi:HEAT repeat-containing protein 6-like [Tachypleus tridentatus]|uniref:HEAT repeat-containing protein 6-like n=1 Tax=Tachypleus tridentatus TaxID=6853 RepID=UPI003FCEF2FA
MSDSGYTHASQLHGTSARSNSFYFPSWSRTSSSESDYSDSEMSQLLKIRSLQAKVRQCTFSALQVIVKAVGKRTIFGFWLSFLPDSPSVACVPQNQTVLTSILKDPSPQVRAEALAFLTELLEGSKPFLSLAEESSSPRTAFTSLSATLASVVRELHRCLLLALVAERIAFLIVQLFKCLTTLVLNASYQRLSPGILSKLFRQVKPFVSHKDPQVVVASLTTLGAVFSIQPPPPEIVDLLKAGAPTELTVSMGVSQTCGKKTELKTTHDKSSCSQEKCPNRELLWLLGVCCDNVKGSVFSKPVPLPVRLESLQLLACLCHGYFFLLRSELSSLRDVILFCLQEEELAIRFHGTKLLEEVGNSLLKEVNQKNSDETSSTTLEQGHTVHQALHLWQQVLNTSLPQCLQSQSHNSLRCVTCDCLSNIGPKVFELLPHDKQIFCLTLLLGLARDEDQNVKGAAVRCLGVYTLYPTLIEDISFLMDVGDVVIDAISDSYFIVRFKASWSLGNLTDAFLIFRDSCPHEQVTDIPDTLFVFFGYGSN